uniref:Uncharacterized protein n=1 Tax=Manihot esculenta TaxID=3983 RepID=A0A2C9W3I0_MANES
MIYISVLCVHWHANCTTLPLAPVTKRFDCGRYRAGNVSGFSLSIRTMVSLAMSPDGRHMPSADEDGTIMMWDLSSGRCVSPLMGQNSRVWTLAFSCEEGSVLASGSADCTVKIWNVTTSTKVTSVKER